MRTRIRKRVDNTPAAVAALTKRIAELEDYQHRLQALFDARGSRMQKLEQQIESDNVEANRRLHDITVNLNQKIVKAKNESKLEEFMTLSKKYQDLTEEIEQSKQDWEEIDAQNKNMKEDLERYEEIEQDQIGVYKFRFAVSPSRPCARVGVAIEIENAKGIPLYKATTATKSGLVELHIHANDLAGSVSSDQYQGLGAWVGPGNRLFEPNK